LPVDKHGRRPLRCYSLSDAPDPRYYRLTIKRVPIAEPDIDRTKNGLSDYLHSTLREGDSLLIKGPQGHFHVDPNFNGPLVLLALGIGITPMISILRWSLKTIPDARFISFTKSGIQNNIHLHCS
jgi:ferredoxin-NADP reductase